METLDKISSKRIDWKLIEDLTLQLLAFGFFMFGIANFIFFIITNDWTFGQQIGKGTLVMLIVISIISICRRFYNSIKDASEKRSKLREIKIEKNE